MMFSFSVHLCSYVILISMLIGHCRKKIKKGKKKKKVDLSSLNISVIYYLGQNVS